MLQRLPADCDNIHVASGNGDLERVRRILSAGDVSISCRLWSMMWAARYGHMEVVELLVGEGADVSVLDRHCNNLYWACVAGDVETVKFVLSLNVVDIDRRGRGSMTPVTHRSGGAPCE